ncbi:putative glycosyltransferase EpsH [bacterium BMS3Abin10]|nr:putative glycosyltransferase EpsH [bacterium BMS3Abin10]GBE39176.1 putative glycosyltransferase EpsH [bacterium BMS3Bbin08]
MNADSEKKQNPGVDRPFVSVVVPAYNSPLRSAECIEALLEQTYPKNKYEIIVIDNGSTDNTPKVIKQYPVVFLAENTIKSPYAARNKGITHSRGEIIAMIDVNCLPVSNWIEEGVKTIESETADLVGGQVKFKFSDARTASELYDSVTNVQIERNIRERNVSKGGNLFVRRAVFDAIGLFPLSRSGGDVSWTRRATRSGLKLVYSPKALATYPARTLLPLIKKQYRVGRGQPFIWRDEGLGYAGLLLRKLVLFLPLLPSVLRKIIDERGTEEIKRLYNYQQSPGRNNRLIVKLWLASYLCNLATGIGAFISMPGVIFRKTK